MHTTQKHLYMALLGFLLLTISCTAVPTQEAPKEAGSDDAPIELLQKKADEWQIVRELGKITSPMDDPLVPSYNVPAFTFARNGKVVWFNETYDRYVEVSSAVELTNALATAKPGDFIHLLDGVYQGNFVVDRSGRADKGIAMYGTRSAVLESPDMKSGYGLYLAVDYWTLFGFSIRKAGKGLVMDRASYNTVNGIEIYQIGEEGLHLRNFSSHNLIEKMWIHDVGLSNPQFGEGIYIGSAVSNWPVYTNNEPDRSDNNRIVGNLLGPNLAAEGIDVKEGTTGGVIRNNSFLTDHNLTADSWIDIKGNDYAVSHNLGAYETGSKFRVAVDVLHEVDNWGNNNSISDNQAFLMDELTPAPFFATERVEDGTTESTYLILVARLMPYTLSELAAYFPDSFQPVGAGTLLLREGILVGQNASLQITADDAVRVHMLSSPERYVSIVGYLSQITIRGLPDQKLDFASWDPIKKTPDSERSDGRAYIFAAGSRMDIDNASFSDLGYEEGTVSGVAWKSLRTNGETVMGRGDVTNSSFMRNYFGAYTFEAIEMRWIGNVFADNVKYGFDPHDFSNYFQTENNIARNNGSHGIIFSRGCSYNVIRGNESFDNAGHGIMLDDGKFLPDGDNERHHVVVPSNYNVIEDNFIMNNKDGIVLEGGEGNIVRNNTIISSQRYGLRFTDKVTDTLVINNTAANSGEIGLFIYEHSGNNEFRQNTIDQSPIGIVFQDTLQTTFIANTVKNIQGSAIVLRGDLPAFVIEDNTFSGSGPEPIRTEDMTGLDVEKLRKNNDFRRWRSPAPPILFFMALSVWLTIFIPPIFATLIRKIKPSRH